MNMNLTKENVEYFWKVLNSNQSSEEKKVADDYLRQFKQSPLALDVCVQLFDSKETTSHFLAAIVLHQIVKERINEIIENKQDFFRYRDLIFNSLLEKMKGSPSYVIERLCYTISILVSVGVITYWPESLEEIINLAKSSKENCYLSLIILENINKELFELNISSKTLMRIKDTLIDKSTLIQEFIFLVLTSVSGNTSVDVKADSQLFNMTLKLTHSWIKFGLNVLKIPILAQTLINSLSSDNIKNVSEIFSDSIQFSNSSKFYSTNDVYDLEEILSKYDKLEIQSIELLIEMIKNSLIKIDANKNELDNIEILDGLANIFASILENFINLMFIKYPLSQTLNEMFFYFISHTNRKISYKFFETVNELREFINRGYKFNNFSDEEKLEYGNFLIKISESVMSNCKLKDLNINPNLLAKKENMAIDDIEAIQAGDGSNNCEDDEDFGVSLADYRKSSEDIFYNIFLIFTYNFNEKGAEFFFNWINSIFSRLNIYDESIATDQSRLLVVEIVILVVKSILDSIDVNDINSKFLINFCSTILGSKILLNDTMGMKFLLLLDQACSILGKDQSMLKTLVNFLLNITKSRLLENTSSYILLEITDFIKTPSLECFKIIYEFYQQNYDNLTPVTVNYLSDSLCNVVGVLDREHKQTVGISDEDIVNYYNYILTPATERIVKTYGVLSNLLTQNPNISESDYNKIKLEFLKNYNVHNGVLKKSFFLTKTILKGTFLIHMKGTADITEAIFKFFVKDTHFIREVCKIYIKSIHHLAEDCVEYFDKFNGMMLNAYLNNYENFYVLSVIKALYSETAKGSQEKKQYISQNFMSLCDMINTNLVQMKKNQVELIDIYAQLIIKVLDTVDYLVNNSDILLKIIDLYLDALKTIAEPSMNKIVIRALTRIISDRKIIPKESTQMKFSEIVYGVFLSCDHYESSSLPDFTNFSLASIEYDEAIFISTLYNLFTHVKFKIFKKEHVDLIIKYLTTIGRNEKLAKLILSDVVSNAKGMGQTEAFMQYEMQIAHYERKQKLEMSN